MQVSDKPIRALVDLVNGAPNLTPYRSGPDLVRLFNQFGFSDEYGQGFPSRPQFAKQRLEQLNSQGKIVEFLTAFFSPSEFIENPQQLEGAVEKLNKYLAFDGFRLVIRGRKSVVEKIQFEEEAERESTKKPEPATHSVKGAQKSRVRADETLRATQQELDDRKSKLVELVRLNRGLRSIERALAWLGFIAQDPETYGDLEALICLICHGQDRSTLIQDVVEQWRAAEERAIEACSRGMETSTPKGRRTYRGGLPIEEARKVEGRSVYELADFWSAHRRQELSIEATMLRTVEWCGIGGFESWWRRLGKNTYDC